MKKVANGKIYDTEKADMVAYWVYSTPNDAYYVLEKLYVTKKRNWFLYGTGGRWSKYSVKFGSNTISGSSRIEIFSLEDAKSWLERHDGVVLFDNRFEKELKEA